MAARGCGDAALEEAGLGFDDCDGAAELAGGAGELEADEAAADDGDAGAGVEAGAEREGVVEGAQVGGAGGGEREAAGGGAGGEEEAGVGEGGAVGEADGAGGAVDGDGLGVKASDSRVLQVAAGEDGGGRGVGEHGRFREGRALVGGVRLGADQGDGVAALAQREGGAGAAFAGADDDHAGGHGWLSLPRRAAGQA